MVYYGRLSRGCERCRQRKIKCDQRQPSCLKCTRSKLTCPGYRNLNDLLFRDESSRIVGRASRSIQVEHLFEPQFSSNRHRLTPISRQTEHAPFQVLPMALVHAHSVSLEDLGTNFYFDKFVSDDIPIASHFRDWLLQSCMTSDKDSVLRLTIEAIGLSAICNISYAALLEIEARRKYSKAMESLRSQLTDPTFAGLDTTLMAVTLLGQYEIVNFKAWDRRENWLAHIQAVTALLEFRGEGQFKRELGAQIYVYARNSIVSACAQQQVVVPLSLVRMTQAFQTSEVRRIWHHHRLASPGSICEFSFRLVNLMATLHSCSDNVRTIHRRALDIDNDHQLWRQSLPHEFEYRTYSSEALSCARDLHRSTQEYPNLFIAEAWNHWRTQRILVNKIITHTSPVQNDQALNTNSVIQQMCADLCTASLNFTDSPRMMSLIEPLFLVSIESSISQGLRTFAIEQLRLIGRSMGIRQATVLADSGYKDLSGSSTQEKPDFLRFESPTNSAAKHYPSCMRGH